MSGAVDYSQDPAVINFQNYLKIRCVHPDIKYDECVTFLKGQAEAMGLPTREHRLPGGLPVLVVTWEGQKPELPSILLNSHMDVVPAEGDWKHPPFAAEIENGVIFGRGSQDMKSVSIQYLEAVRRLRAQGVTLRRTVHMTFVPEEEKGGTAGMGEFVKTEAFNALNPGFALDEGLASAGEECLVFNGEKSMWQVKIICTGESGHGSMLLPETSGEKMRYMIDKFLDLRDMYRQQLVDHSGWTIGDVTTINLTKLEITRWCKEAGSGVSFEFEHKDPYVAPTPLENNPYWDAMKTAIEKMHIPLRTRTMPCATDARFLRGARVLLPALNFSPARRTQPAPHTRDESLPLDVFINGISVYEEILKAVANV